MIPFSFHRTAYPKGSFAFNTVGDRSPMFLKPERSQTRQVDQQRPTARSLCRRAFLFNDLEPYSILRKEAIPIQTLKTGFRKFRQSDPKPHGHRLCNLSHTRHLRYIQKLSRAAMSVHTKLIAPTAFKAHTKFIAHSPNNSKFRKQVRHVRHKIRTFPPALPFLHEKVRCYAKNV